MIEEGLYTYLTGVSAVSAIIGNRLYLGQAPAEPDYPYAVYQQISDVPDVDHSGGLNLTTARYQITTWAKTAKQAKQGAQAIRKAVHARRGSMGSVSDVTSFSKDIVDIPDEGTRLHGAAVDVHLTYIEA